MGVFFISTDTAQKIPVILDTDIGDDVDDAYALMFAASSPELDILGVTTVHGNTPARARLVQKLLRQLGKQIPVYSGEAGKGDPQNLSQKLEDQLKTLTPEEQKMEVQTGAVDFIIRTLHNRPGEVVLIPYGPQSNIAAALKKDPSIRSKIKRIVTMGGQIYSARTGKLPPDRSEYNIKSDALAAQVVFSSSVPLTMVGLDVTYQLDLPESYLPALEKSANPACQYLARLTKVWGRRTLFMHDPLAVAVTIDPTLVFLQKLHIEVDSQGYTRLRENKTPNVDVALWVDRRRFLSLLMSRVGQIPIA